MPQSFRFFPNLRHCVPRGGEVRVALAHAVAHTVTNQQVVNPLPEVGGEVISTVHNNSVSVQTVVNRRRVNAVRLGKGGNTSLDGMPRPQSGFVGYVLGAVKLLTLTLLPFALVGGLLALTLTLTLTLTLLPFALLPFALLPLLVGGFPPG